MAANRYGHIDLASKFWPDQNHWIKMLEIPVGWFPHWRVLDSKSIVKHIACNIDIHGPLMSALTEVRFHGLGQELHTFDGCFNIRQVRGATSISAHAYGLALDLNAAENPLGSLHSKFSSKFVDCFIKFGFSWGGNFHGRKDPMHFSWCWE